MNFDLNWEWHSNFAKSWVHKWPQGIWYSSHLQQSFPFSLVNLVRDTEISNSQKPWNHTIEPKYYTFLLPTCQTTSIYLPLLSLEPKLLRSPFTAGSYPEKPFPSQISSPVFPKTLSSHAPSIWGTRDSCLPGFIFLCLNHYSCYNL